MTKILFLVLVGLFVLGVGINWFTLNYLKKTYPQKWLELGSPSLFWNNSIRNNIRALRFEWSDEHKALKDKFLDKMIRLEKILSMIYFVVFISLILNTIIQSGSKF